jgi:hypothetical protein
MRRRGIASHSVCPLYDQDDETSDHLAVGCVLAREVWHSALQRCNLQHLTPEANSSLIEWWPRARQHAPPQSKKGLDSLVLLVVWTLWKERNSKRIADEVELWKISGAVGLGLVWR